MPPQIHAVMEKANDYKLFNTGSSIDNKVTRRSDSARFCSRKVRTMTEVVDAHIFGKLYVAFASGRLIGLR
jgi:hypothetical protein